MNVLVIGLGSIGRKHVKCLNQIDPAAEIYALRSTPQAETFDGVHNIYSHKELSVQPDFVIISNPTKYHKEAILEASTYKCPLFIEKPIVACLSDADEIEAALNSQRKISYTACNLRFHPSLVFLKKYLAEKDSRVNEVNVYCGSFLPDWRPGQDYRDSYSARSELGGGVELDLIHEIDYCYWLFGRPREVFSLKRKISSLDINSNDFAVYHLLYSQFVVNITLNYYRKDRKRTIELVIEEETLTVDLLTTEVRNHSGNILFKDEGYDIGKTYVSQMKYFVDHMRENLQPMNGFAEAVEVLKIALQ